MQHDDDLALLVGILVKAAQSLLKKQRGEFFPFAATIDAQGKPAMVGADVGEEKPKSNVVITFLRGALKAQAEQGAIKASGICANVGACLPGYADKVDAICCFVERRSAPPVDFYIPFRKSFFKGFKYDKPVALPGTPAVFGSTGGVA